MGSEMCIRDSYNADESDDIETAKLVNEKSTSDEFHEAWRKFELVEDE